MSNLIVNDLKIASMSDDSVNCVREYEQYALTLPQVEIQTTHLIHAGMYARTAFIPADVVMSGALIKIPTTLIIAGDVSVFTGNNVERLTGYIVLAAEQNRKQLFRAHADTYLTMLFATTAETIADAEDQFTDEAEMLQTRR